MQITRLGPFMGAEISGLDISQTLDATAVQSVLAAFHAYHILCFREQNLSPRAQVLFSRNFGALEDQLNAHYTVEGEPEVLVLSNDVKDGKPVGLIDGGDFWHSDSSHRENPSLATVLHAIRLPSQGGDTEFADTVAAYEALPEDWKRRVASMKAIHAVSKLRNKRVTVSQNRKDAKDFYERQKSIPDQVWPLVRTHPATGRKALYISPRFTIGIEGLSEEDADPILDHLFAHQIRQEFLYRHRWRPGDLLLWDNRSVMHRATGGFIYPDIRTMHRTVVAGDRPY